LFDEILYQIFLTCAYILICAIKEYFVLEEKINE